MRYTPFWNLSAISDFANGERVPLAPHSGSESLKSGQNPTYLWFCPKLLILFLFPNQNLLFDSWPISTKYMSSLIYQSVKRGKKKHSFICISYKAFPYWKRLFTGRISGYKKYLTGRLPGYKMYLTDRLSGYKKNLTGRLYLDIKSTSQIHYLDIKITSQIQFFGKFIHIKPL